MKATLLKLYRKIVGKWMVFRYVHERAILRSIVYNYVIQNEMTGVLGRLWERTPTYDTYRKGWNLYDPWQHGTVGGFIAYRPVTDEQFKKAFKKWGWLDDDSRNDTTDVGFLRELVFGEGDTDRTRHLWALLFRDELENAYYNALVHDEGSAFDLGDTRNREPFYDFFATLAWNDRNTAMNFQYWEGY